MGRIAIELRFEAVDKITHQRTLIGRIELHDPDIADCRLTSLLFESKRQPNRAQLDRFAAAAFDNAGLHQGLGDLQALTFEGVSRYDIDIAEPGNAGGDRREVVDITPEADVFEYLAALLFKR